MAIARKSRAEKSADTRRSLLEAALSLVGEIGYGNTSISQITKKANVAQGSFYNYFDSRQDIFDRLLPYLGDELLNFIGQRVVGISDPGSREEVGFRALSNFMGSYPEFYRIFSEAFVFAPAGHKNYVSQVINGYIRGLERSKRRGFLPEYDLRELEVLAYAMLGTRFYLYMNLSFKGEDYPPALGVPEWIVGAYMKFIRYGLEGRSSLAGELQDVAVHDRSVTASCMVTGRQLGDVAGLASNVVRQAGIALGVLDPGVPEPFITTQSCNIEHIPRQGRIEVEATLDPSETFLTVRLTQIDAQPSCFATVSAVLSARRSR